jgi:hypothetical protein
VERRECQGTAPSATEARGLTYHSRGRFPRPYQSRPLEGKLCRTSRGRRQPAAPAPLLDRPVWVDLEAFWGPPDVGIADAGDPVPGGLPVATGRVPGLLKRWVRSTDGRWFGRVNFKITDKYGAEVAEHVSELVPASALRPREPR